MIHAVLPDLHQLEIPTPFPVGPVNVYAAYEADELTLVDCGPRTPEARAALNAGLSALGHSARDVRRILVTHAHSDHYGLARELASESGAQVLTHPFNRPTLQAYEEERDRRNRFYAELAHEVGVPDDVRAAMAGMRRGIGEYATAVTVSGDLNDGDKVRLAGREWHVLHTPGHSSGLVCLYEPESRVLLSNDHLLRDISSNPLVEPPPPGRTERLRSLVEYITQLKRVATLDISTAWPGHGEPIHDVVELVRQREAFHQQRAGRIVELLNGTALGRLTAFQVARSLFPRLDPMNFFLAISEVLGHLEWLEVEGRVTSAWRDGVMIWQLEE